MSVFGRCLAWVEPLRQDCDESHHQVDRLLIKTAAGQAGIGNNDGHITSSASPVTGRANPQMGHAVVTDTNPRRSPRTGSVILTIRKPHHTDHRAGVRYRRDCVAPESALSPTVFANASAPDVLGLTHSGVG